MIEKLKTPKSINWDDTPEAMLERHYIISDVYEKINELCDIINTIQKEREAERFEIQEWIGILEAVRKSVNVHETQIDELQMKLEPDKTKDPYAEQRKWIGKLCKVYDDNDFIHYAVLEKIFDNSNYCYGTQIGDYRHCEPVKPDSEIIYHGE